MHASLDNLLSSSDPPEFASFLENLNDDDAHFLLRNWHLIARDEQLPPPGAWRIWLYLGGRGAGKTRSGAEWIAQGVAEGAMHRIGLIGATYNDARAVMIEGVSGLLAAAPGATFEPSNRRVIFAGGARATVLSADEPDGIRGHQFDAIWGDELGCPAVDKGANQPNVFVDPKSAESALPHFSNGERDDLIQRRFLEAHFAHWAEPTNNPVSAVTGDPMVDTSHIYVWCWDARPYPFFPARADVWGDAANWRLGHWLNGRLGTVALRSLIEAIAPDVDAAALDGLVTGYGITATMSARDALEPLSVAFHFDAIESEGVIKCVPRGRADADTLTTDDLAIPEDAATFGFRFTRAQETDLPAASRIAYIDADADYRQASVESHRLVTPSARIASSALPVAMDLAQATGIADRLLQDAWTMRESATFALPPSHLARDVADEIVLDANGRSHRLRLTQIDDAAARHIEAVATDPALYEPTTGPAREPLTTQTLQQPGRALLVFLDLPLLTGKEVPWAPHVAAFASPWPGAVQVLRSTTDANFALDTTLTKPATLGETTADFSSGVPWRWDKANALHVRLYGGTLESRTDADVLGGANALAIENADGEWEIVQFANAELTAPNTWTLTRLLRGRNGTEAAMRDPVAAGARVVLLDSALKQLALTQNEATLAFNYRWGPSGKPLSDPAFQCATKRFAAIGLRPYAPIRVRGRWQTGGDILLTWIRRTRLGGDSWDQVPLGEEREAYDIDILDGATVVRTIVTTEPRALYTAAQQTADFGALPATFDVIVHQRSAAFGRGIGTRKTIHAH